MVAGISINHNQKYSRAHRMLVLGREHEEEDAPTPPPLRIFSKKLFVLTFRLDDQHDDDDDDVVHNHHNNDDGGYPQNYIFILPKQRYMVSDSVRE